MADMTGALCMFKRGLSCVHLSLKKLTYVRNKRFIRGNNTFSPNTPPALSWQLFLLMDLLFLIWQKKTVSVTGQEKDGCLSGFQGGLVDRVPPADVSICVDA